MEKVLNYPGITMAVWDKENKGKGQKGSEKTWRSGTGPAEEAQLVYEFAVIILNLHLWANRRKILVQVNLLANAISTQSYIKKKKRKKKFPLSKTTMF